MNKLSFNIPNKIKQPSQCCQYCGKSYIKRNNLDKHIIICELLHNVKNNNIPEDELQIPSDKKMFQMMLKLGERFSKLEEKVEEMNKYIIKKKKKINVLEWLNENIKPRLTFDIVINNIEINEKHILSLFENSFYDILNDIFEESIYKFNKQENPIFSFIQKNNVFYIYDFDKIWKELSKENLIKFLNKIHMKIIKEFYDWKKKMMNEIKINDNFATKCNKTSVKLMSIEFKQEQVLTKIKNLIFTNLKTDMKSLIEYEFEF
jgi:hypothetical protein